MGAAGTPPTPRGRPPAVRRRGRESGPKVGGNAAGEWPESGRRKCVHGARLPLRPARQSLREHGPLHEPRRGGLPRRPRSSAVRRTPRLRWAHARAASALRFVNPRWDELKILSPRPRSHRQRARMRCGCVSLVADFGNPNPGFLFPLVAKDLNAPTNSTEAHFCLLRRRAVDTDGERTPLPRLRTRPRYGPGTRRLGTRTRCQTSLP